MPLRRKRLTRGRRKPSAVRARQRVKEQHFPPPRSDRSHRPSCCQHLSPPGEPGRSPLAVRSSGKRGVGAGEANGERSPLRAPHRRRTPSPRRSSGKEQWGREPTAPAEGRGRAARRESPRPSLFLPGVGQGSAAAGPTANPVPPRGRRRAEGAGGGGRSPGTASSQPHGGTLLAAAGSHPPLPPGRLPLPWPPSPPARQSRARRSLPPSPSSRCMGSGAERGAEPSGGAAARRLTRSPPAAIPPAAGALNPCGAAQAGLPSRGEPAPAPAEASDSRRPALGLPHPPAPRPPYGGPETGGGGAGPRRGRTARNGGGGECPRYRATRAPRTHRSPPYPPPGFSSGRRKGKVMDGTRK